MRDFLFGSKSSPRQVELDTRRGATHFVNRAAGGGSAEPGSAASAAKQARDAVEKKNAVYCALVFKEFLKELAALSQEHAVAQLDVA